MGSWQQHLPILPVVLPLLTGTVLLLISETRHRLRATIALLATFAQLLLALTLLAMTDAQLPAPWHGEIAVYSLGNWAAPFGIVLVADRLAAIMLTLTATLGSAALLYSLARWERAGVHYLPLFQFLLMGLNGAFLTGDLFNLFVFFEVLLAASYGLALHGSGVARVKAGLHYIVVNLAASLLFLVAAALIYGVTGTLNMAELALRVQTLSPDDRTLFDIGAVLLGVVFLVKAGAWPLNFWLPTTYAAASAPVAGVFAILTKVGIYALLRFETLLHATGSPAPFGGEWLFHCGLATIAIGSLGILATQRLERLAGFLVIVSSGTLLAAIGFRGTALTGPALFYLVSSVLGGGAFFMVVEMVQRNRAYAADLLAISFEAFGLQDPASDTERPDETVGLPIPGAMAFLGLTFVSCALLLTGLPPLSGFVAKFSLLAAAIAEAPGGSSLPSWLFVAALLLSGLAGIISLSRLGMRVFWSGERSTPRLLWVEAGPVAGLIALCAILALAAGPATDYFRATAESLHNPAAYIHAVLPAYAGGAGE
ncbi:MAG: monovalent cation/H+ antiporter subunit D [Thiobacillus sp. 63-78]|uniref:monovalent cation/H+ antiporter subunit D n=1 Tax=Thiobacillus sp. 63-78 TaxID=1895859 RepID=UPI00095F7BA6|nr:monovalent cation/H+ antiporter subunit D [Thiobacillus sp. 63-78]MBN8772959.1 monovalent cation/H+ antiporter subunit D [Thiobacillus sp.]OJZ16810.1 MAG: monovalent cation/H+ antiporter subunit D [Thiobacillus sp. 63-78]